MSATFRLAAVLRVRRVQEDAARAAVGVATARAAVAEEEARTRAAQALAPAPSQPGGARAFLADGEARLRRAQDATAARAAADGAHDAVGESLRRWSEAATRARPLERLAEAHIRHRQAEQDRAAANAADDLAAAAWQRARARDADPQELT